MVVWIKKGRTYYIQERVRVTQKKEGRGLSFIYIRERGKVTLIQEGKDLLHTVERWRVTPIQGLIYGTEVLLALKDS